MYSGIRNLKILFFVLLIILVLALVMTGRVMKTSYVEFPVLFNSQFVIMQLKYLRIALSYANDFGNVDTASAAKAESVPVLVYHGISESTDKSNVPPDGVSISPEKFRDQMFALKQAGYRTISSEELYRFMRGEQALPEKSFLLTFDDGRKDSFYPADPILRALGFKAVMFVITKFSFGEQSIFYLGPPELHYMKNSGRWEIQSHGSDDHEFYEIGRNGEQGHFLSNLFWLPDKGRFESEDEFVERIRKDLNDSRNTIESELGTRAPFFAFPFGDFGEQSTNRPGGIKNILLPVVRSVYSIAFFQVGNEKRFTQNYFGQYQGEDSFLARRIEFNQSWSGEQLIEELEKGSSKKLPYADDFKNNNGWLTTWSDAPIESDQMTLRARLNETGAAVILDGTYFWKDYELEADFDLIRGNNVYIWVRFKDNLNYAACNFINGNLVHIEESVGGKLRVARGVTRREVFPEGEFKAGVIVSGRSIACTINGETVIETAFLDPVLDRGGIGFKTWNPNNNSAELAVLSLRVRPVIQNNE